MDFGPHNKVVKLCLQGMSREEQGVSEEALGIFMDAWNQATDNLEKFIAAYFIGRSQGNIGVKATWLDSALQIALKINDDTVKSAFPVLYKTLADCYQALNDVSRATTYYELAVSLDSAPSDCGPFFHGTKANLRVGEFLRAGGVSNYKADLRMHHIYFTALAHGAGLAAAMAKGDDRERVYVVEPTGPFENDPNVTNKKFPGNPTRSYRTESPLKVVGEITDWQRLSPDELEKWRMKVAKNKGEIVD